MQLGDIVSDGALRGVVVAYLDRDEFNMEYPREHWGHLRQGVLVSTEEAGLVHYPDANALVVVSP